MTTHPAHILLHAHRQHRIVTAPAKVVKATNRMLKTVSFGIADQNLLDWVDTQGTFSQEPDRP